MNDILVSASNKPNCDPLTEVPTKESIVYLTRAKFVDEFERLLKHIDIQVDEKGHKRSLYERQAEFILSRFNVWKLPPSFVFHTSHLIRGSPLEKEFNGLDDESLDDVMKEVGGLDQFLWLKRQCAF